MDPVQTAPTGAVCSGSTLFLEASNMLVEGKKHTFCDYVL